MPKRLDAPLGTCTRVVRSSKAGISRREFKTSWLYCERPGVSRSPLHGFWEAEIRVKDGGLVVSGRGVQGDKERRGGGMTTPEATRCIMLPAPMRADLKYPCRDR